jgi:hypothetical protein
MNPIIGTCGDRVDPTFYFISMFVLHVAASAVLPGKWRTALQWTSIGVEGQTVYKNWREGFEP